MPNKRPICALLTKLKIVKIKFSKRKLFRIEPLKFYGYVLEENTMKKNFTPAYMTIKGSYHVIGKTNNGSFTNGVVFEASLALKSSIDLILEDKSVSKFDAATAIADIHALQDQIYTVIFNMKAFRDNQFSDQLIFSPKTL